METLERFQAERSDLVGFVCFCVDSHCRGQGWKEGDLVEAIAIAVIQVRSCVAWASVVVMEVVAKWLESG